MDSTESDGTSSASESSVEMLLERQIRRKTDEDVASKKRKNTYYVRKDEIKELQDHIKQLEAQLEHHERQAPQEHVTLAKTQRMNGMLAESVNQNGMAVAGAQATLSAYNLAAIKMTGLVPLQDYIHLPVDLDARKAILASLYKSKIHKTAQFMTERTRDLDLEVVHEQSEQFELVDGHVGLMRMSIVPIRSGHSVRQVYDALVSVAMNQEITMSEKLGVVTIRESEELEQLKYCQTRLLSSMGGLQVEANIAMFGRYVDATATESAYGLAAIDFVNQDDIYPYRPETCMRKELTVGVLVRELPSIRGGISTVVVARWSYIRILPPHFPLPDNLKEAVHANMLQWSGDVPKIMKERLMTIPPAHTNGRRT